MKFVLSGVLRAVCAGAAAGGVQDQSVEGQRRGGTKKAEDGERLPARGGNVDEGKARSDGNDGGGKEEVNPKVGQALQLGYLFIRRSAGLAQDAGQNGRDATADPDQRGGNVQKGKGKADIHRKPQRNQDGDICI